MTLSCLWRQAKLRVVFKAFDFDNTNSLNENQFFEVGRALKLQGREEVFQGFALDGTGQRGQSARTDLRDPRDNSAMGDVVDNVPTSEWSREENTQALEEIMQKRSEATAFTADFTIRNVGGDRVCTMEEFVDYFMEKFQGVPDEILNQQAPPAFFPET